MVNLNHGSGILMTNNELSRLVVLYTRQICTHNEILDMAWQDPNLTSDDIWELQEYLDDNEQCESEGKEATRLGQEQTDFQTWLREGHGLDSDSDNGGEWSRRYADKLVEAAIPIQHRVQESGEVQRDIRHDRSSSWAWKAAANCLSKDEP